MQKRLIHAAMICVLLSVVLHVLASRWIGVAFDYGLPIRWMYVTVHLLAGYGMAVLLWPAVRRSVNTRRRRESSVALGGDADRWEVVAICAIVAYHVVAAVAFSMEFACFFYEVTLGFWLLKTFFCVFLILDFITEDRLPLRPAGLLLIIICVANSPYQLPGNWAFVQWFTAKVAMVALAVELYCVDMELSKNQ